MDIDVQREQRFILEGKPELLESRFFLGFAKRHLLNVNLTVGMASQLEPAIEFAVVGQQDALSIGCKDPCRSGEMTRPAIPLKTISSTFDQSANFIKHLLFIWVAVLISVQQIEEGFAVHGAPNCHLHREIAQGVVWVASTVCHFRDRASKWSQRENARNRGNQ